jgi:hypothetical protein
VWRSHKRQKSKRLYPLLTNALKGRIHNSRSSGKFMSCAQTISPTPTATTVVAFRSMRRLKRSANHGRITNHQKISIVANNRYCTNTQYLLNYSHASQQATRSLKTRNRSRRTTLPTADHSGRASGALITTNCARRDHPLTLPALALLNSPPSKTRRFRSRLWDPYLPCKLDRRRTHIRSSQRQSSLHSSSSAPSSSSPKR